MAKKSTPLIKMCGMTREADAVRAVELGAQAIGLLFYDKSPRFVTIDQAAGIAAAVAENSLRVGLFVDAGEEYVRQVLDSVPLDILQFHGNESQAYCLQFGLPFWKTLRAQPGGGLAGQIAGYPHASGILLDTWHPTKAGGTGETFDWSVVDELDRPQHLVLAGGLNPDNIHAAINKVKPWAVDVCSGVEASPGIKSGELMQRFIEEVRRV